MGTIKILIIDDSPDDIILIRRHFQSIVDYNFEIDSDTSWTESREKFTGNGYSLLLVDYMLGECTAFDVVSEIRKTDEITPIIIITGQGNEHIAADVIRVGADDYLIKNEISPEMLRVAILSTIKRSSHREALRESEERYRLVFDSSNDAILLTSLDGSVYKVNESACRMFKRSEHEIKQIGLNGIVNNSDSELAAALEEGNRTGRFHGELTYIRKSGESFPGEVSISRFKDSYGNIRTSMIIRDVSERKKAEKEIQQLLKEKDIILKEVHHRIKNNMNVIYSLLHLQADTLKEQPAVLALEDAGNRVLSMMVLYDKLYRSYDFYQAYDFKKISVMSYLSSLVDEIISNFPNGKIVKVIKRISDFEVKTEKIQTLGLIINELITNIMKYAFKGRDRGLITISASMTGTKASLIIQDDGIGIDNSIDFENITSFGLRMVKFLLKDLDGTIRIQSEKGTKISLEFKPE